MRVSWEHWDVESQDHEVFVASPGFEDDVLTSSRRGQLGPEVSALNVDTRRL